MAVSHPHPNQQRLVAQPAAFRPPAFASWVILSRWGIQPSSRSAYRTPPCGPDPSGVSVLRMNKLRPGWALSLSRGRWCPPGQGLAPAGTCRFPRPVPAAPPAHFPSAGGTFTRRQREFTPFTHHPRPGWLPAQGREPRLQAPAGLLLAHGPRMEHGPLRLLPRAPHPAVTRDARQGGDGPSRTGPGTTPPASSAGPPTVPPTACRAATFVAKIEFAAIDLDRILGKYSSPAAPDYAGR